MGIWSGLKASLSTFTGLWGGYAGSAYHSGTLHPNPDQPFQRGFNTADNEISDGRENTVAWTRHLWRNDPKIATLYRLRAEAVVGTNLRLEACPEYTLLNRNPEWADDWSSNVERWFKMWARDDQWRCDAHMKMTWGLLARLAYFYWDAEGECLAVVRMLDRGGMFETCIEIMDPERLCNPPGVSNSMILANGNRVVDGVELDRNGAPFAYHIRVMHESESVASVDKFKWERIERFNRFGRPNVIHAVNERRASQRRGIAPMSAGISTINRYGEYERAVVGAWKNHAKMFPWIESSAPLSELEAALPDGIAGEENGRYSVAEELANQRLLKPVRIDETKFFVGWNEKIHAERGNLGDSPANFLAQGDRQLSGVAGVPYPMAFNSWDEVTYSSGQMMLAASDRGEQQDLDAFTSKFCMPVYRCVLEEMILKGRVKPARRTIDFYTMTTAYTMCRFWGPGNIVGDPVKAGVARDHEMRQNFSPWSELVSRSGRDPDEVRMAIARDMRKHAEMGIPPFVPISGVAAINQQPGQDQNTDQAEQEDNQNAQTN